MSGHIKTQIRERVADLIQQGVPGFSTVRTTRVRPTASVPWCSVATPAMSLAQEDTGGWPRRFYEIDVEVVIAVAEVSGYDAVLDDWEGKVTAVLAAEKTLGGLAKLFTLESTDDEWSDELDRPVGRLSMIWRALVRIDATEPETAIQ